jgi:RHS repeat-associated protein
MDERSKLDGTQKPSNQDGASGSLPSITLPKGGGAIRGLGEKFGANPTLGTGSLTIPIFTTPGRADFYPKLSLAYDSGASNGPFGVGWSLSIPAISRKTEKGLPEYKDFDDSDTFILSDAEDLIPILIQDQGGGWGQDVFPEKLNGADYTVKRFRPRVESTFARIEHWTDAAGGSFWKTITRENVTSLYGTTAASQIVNPSDSTQIFKWLLERTYDSHGNAVSYVYKPENADNIPPAVYEQSHSVGANRYLKQVLYGSQTPYYPAATSLVELPASWHFQVVFDYGEHDPVTPTPEEASLWNVRQDPFSSYRATFEVRTYRLCTRVLMFHNFDELGTTPCLVRSTDFTYGPNPSGTTLISVKQTGYIRNSTTQTYQVVDPSGTRLSPISTPPLDLEYSVPQIDPTLHFVDSRSMENLPGGADGRRYRWNTLENDGLTGILTEQGGTWFYKRNISSVPRDANGLIVPADSATPGTVSAYFEPGREVAQSPSLADLGSGRQQLLDLAGDGRQCLVQYDKPVAGFYEEKAGEGWLSFRPFRFEPNLDWQDPNLRFIDLDGDGHSDVLITEDDVFTWYQSRAREGFGPANRTAKPLEEDQGPALVFAGGDESIYLADFSGDGLQDIVRVRSGEICYWPNLGYGRFGAKIIMEGAPVFDRPDQFDQERVRLADIDGSGTTDLIYLGRDKTSFWFNQSGNGWSATQHLPEFSATDNADSVSVLDLLGTGTACIVWSSPLPGDLDRPMRYIDLMGGQKPHLLISTTNNMGARTTVQYAPSTKFYLLDKFAGKPWLTKLPFPVHVVESVLTTDFISETQLTSRYAYHHGYYDGVEREFRGFGMVEQFDTFSYSRYSGTGTFSQTPEAVGENFYLPAVRTKNWYHTGIYFGAGRIARHFEDEYFQGDPQFPRLPDVPLPPGLTGDEVREACRALKGKSLRTEIYSEDGSAAADKPYAVSESAYEVLLLQPRLKQRYAGFWSFESETVSAHYERNPSDPRIIHNMNLGVDNFGNITDSVSIAYPRRPQLSPLPAQQTQLLLTYTKNVFANVTDQPTWYRVGVPVETRSFELTGASGTGVNGQFDRGQLQVAVSTASQISYETSPDGSLQKRLIGGARTTYLKDDLSGALATGSVDSLALPYKNYKMAFTSGLLNDVYSSKIAGPALEALLSNEGGYIDLDGDGNWWIPYGQLFFSPNPATPDVAFAKAHFYLVQAFVDPFGNTSNVQYDNYFLLVTQTQDPLHNTVVAQQHYRIVQPWLVTDANQNRTGVRFDAFGVVVAAAVMGKAGKSEGDVLDLTTSEASASDDPTTRMEYELFNWTANGLPNFVHTYARQLHGPANPRWQESYSYSDGVGREMMKKIQAEPGMAPARDSSGALQRDSGGNLVFANSNTRWVGTGRTVLDNKGNPIKKYEPFFDSSAVYDDEKDLVQWGVTPILTYDPLGRLIRTDYPDGTLARVEFDAWQTVTSDPNDTVLESKWHTTNQALPAGDPDKDADTKATADANTPAVAQLDSLGRKFASIQDNGVAGKYTTTTGYDIQGNPLSITDANARVCMISDYSMLGAQLHLKSSDAGERWTLNDIADKPIRVWNSRGFQLRFAYDTLRRQIELFVTPQGSAEFLAERTVYGEGVAAASDQNLLTRVFQIYSAAGCGTNVGFDFKGNLLSTSFELCKQFQQTADWSVLAGLTDPQQIAAAAQLSLQAETLVSSTTFDALNRPITMKLPDTSVIHSTFNDANLLETVNINLRGAAASTPLVTNIDYNARGQRNQIAYGNGSETSYSYDPESFRLIELKTLRTSDAALLQDLSYAYDPAGNVTSIRDGSQETIYFNNQVVSAACSYTYDAIYRISNATGREHIGQAAQPQTTWDDSPRMNQPLPTDATAMRNYTEAYSYDAVGNILAIIHQATNGNWTRSFAYDQPNLPPTNNRLTSSSVGTDSEAFTFDAHGNILRMNHLPVIGWDFKDQLQSTQQQVTNGGGAETTFYVYGATGQRVRKVSASAKGTPTSERIYLGPFELYREYSSTGGVSLERQTVRVMDDKQCVVLIETKTVGISVAGESPASSVFRFQYGNQIGSICLELDDSAAIISYEEYYPYGSTSYQAVSSKIDVSAKRYRYTAKERDDETGFSYHGARYYAPWLARWISCDPIGIRDDINLYAYVKGRPTTFFDPKGTDGKSNDDPKPDAQGFPPPGYTYVEVRDQAGNLVGTSMNKNPDAAASEDEGPDPTAPSLTQTQGAAGLTNGNTPDSHFRALESYGQIGGVDGEKHATGRFAGPSFTLGTALRLPILGEGHHIGSRPLRGDLMFYSSVGGQSTESEFGSGATFGITPHLWVGDKSNAFKYFIFGTFAGNLGQSPKDASPVSPYLQLLPGIELLGRDDKDKLTIDLNGWIFWNLYAQDATGAQLQNQFGGGGALQLTGAASKTLSVGGEFFFNLYRGAIPGATGGGPRSATGWTLGVGFFAQKTVSGNSKVERSILGAEPFLTYTKDERGPSSTGTFIFGLRWDAGGNVLFGKRFSP